MTAAGFPWAFRLALATVIAGGACVIGLMAHALVHPDLGSSPLAGFGHNNPMLVITVGAGALVGGALAWGLAGRHPRAVWTGAVIGAVPPLLTCAHLFRP